MSDLSEAEMASTSSMGDDTNAGASAAPSPFGPAPDCDPVAAALGSDGGALEGETLDLVGIMSALQETAFSWNVLSGCIDWESNAAEVLGVADPTSVSTAAGYEELIAAEHREMRMRQLLDASRAAVGVEGGGVPYQVTYRLRPGGPRSSVSLWLVERGRCWVDAGCRLVKARGIVRVTTDESQVEGGSLRCGDRDELTGQLNRIRLLEALSSTLQRSAERRVPSALLMVSVNNLAMVNENFGYEIGDEVIAATARAIQSKLRGGDSLGRYSSNKFGIILNDCGAGTMRIAADRFMKVVRDNPVKTSACRISANISVGGILLPDHADTVGQAFGRGLKALEVARGRRGDVLHCYEPSTAGDSLRRRNMKMIDELVTAFEQNRMLLALQPVVSTLTREVAFYECLLRMRTTDGGIVSAGNFIPVAEQLGYSRMIDLRTLELAAGVLRSRPTIRLSLNVSGLTAGDAEWMAALLRLVAHRRDIAERLIIEITETAALHDFDQLIGFVDTVKEVGCKVAIDDFGAGYTSFKNLKMLAVDMVKIDGAFVKDLAPNSRDHAFLRALNTLAEDLGLTTVAEWVGGESSIELLKEVGITHLQGNYIAPPVLVDELETDAVPAAIAKAG